MSCNTWCLQTTNSVQYLIIAHTQTPSYFPNRPPPIVHVSPMRTPSQITAVPEPVLLPVLLVLFLRAGPSVCFLGCGFFCGV